MNYLLQNTVKPTSEEKNTPEKDIKPPKNTVLEVETPKNPEIPKEVEKTVEDVKTVETETKATGDNTESAHNYFTTPREKKDEKPPQEEAKEETPPNEGGGEEKPTEEVTNSFGLDKEECYAIGEFIAESGDLIIPQIAAYLNEEKDVSQYEAGEKHIKSIAKAWGRFLYEKQIDVSPAQQIMISTAIAYALPLAGGIKHRLPHIVKFIKRMFSNLMKNNPPPNPETAKDTNKESKTIKTTEKEEETLTEKEEVKTKVEETKCCKEDSCNTYFENGSGFAKGKNAANYDAFCSKPCMYKYTGRQSKGNQKKVK